MAAPGAPLSPASLQTPQLRSLERQLEEENTLLTANFNQLKMAQQKFTDAAAVVAALTPDKKGAAGAASPSRPLEGALSMPPIPSRSLPPSPSPPLRARQGDSGAPDGLPVRCGRAGP